MMSNSFKKKDLLVLLIGLGTALALQFICNSVALSLLMSTRAPVHFYVSALVFNPITHDGGLTGIPSLIAFFLNGILVGYLTQKTGWLKALLVGILYIVVFSALNGQLFSYYFLQLLLFVSIVSVPGGWLGEIVNLHASPKGSKNKSSKENSMANLR